MNGDHNFAKEISNQLFQLEDQLIKSLEIHRAFITMAFELLQEHMPFADRKAFEEWLTMMNKLQR